MAPVVTDLYEKRELERLQSLYQTITRWVITLSFPVFAALIIESGLLREGLRRRSWPRRGRCRGSARRWESLLYRYGRDRLRSSMTGRPGINLINSVVAVALYIGAGALVVPHDGAVGMAAVDASVTALINGARVVQAKFLVRVHPFGGSPRKPLLALGGAAAATHVESRARGRLDTRWSGAAPWRSRVCGDSRCPWV
jgi:hypothetical protein